MPLVSWDALGRRGDISSCQSVSLSNQVERKRYDTRVITVFGYSLTEKANNHREFEQINKKTDTFVALFRIDKKNKRN